MICSLCGAIAPEADVKLGAGATHKHFCGHDSSNWVQVRRIIRKEGRPAKCPACGFGTFRRFYLGSEAATAVLGTELFEQLPSEEITVVESSAAQTRRSVFAKAPQQRQIRKNSSYRRISGWGMSGTGWGMQYLHRRLHRSVRERRI